MVVITHWALVKPIAYSAVPLTPNGSRSLLGPAVSVFRTLSNTSDVNGLLFKNKANAS